MLKFAKIAALLALCLAFLGSSIRFSTEKKDISKLKPARAQGLPVDRNARWALFWKVGSPFLTSVTPTDDGGFLVCVSSYSRETLYDVKLIKFSSDLEVEWQNTFGGAGDDGWSNVTARQTPDGGYLVLSDTDSFGTGMTDLWLLRLSPTGSVIWQRTYGTPGYETGDGEVQLTSDGGCVVVGSIFTLSRKDSSIWVLKLDAAGNIEWQISYGNPLYYEGGCSIQQTSDGGYIIAGQQIVKGTYHYRPVALMLSAKGDIEWQRAFGDFEAFYSSSMPGTYETNFPQSIREAAGGGYYLVDDTFAQSAGDKDVWVIRLSETGKVIWQKLYGGIGADWGRHVLALPDGGCVIAAESFSFGASPRDVWLFELDPSGNIRWQKTYCAGGIEESFSIDSAKDGDLLVAAKTSNQDSSGAFILKVSPDGELGPCAYVTESKANVTVPTFVSEDAGMIAAPTTATITTTMVIPQPISSTYEFVCWSLNQPPADISVSQEANRSLFAKEHYNKLTWSPNPWNDRFALREYRVYKKGGADVGYQYRLLASLPATARSYLDGPVDANSTGVYTLTSVDSNGRESPKSVPVRAK